MFKKSLQFLLAFLLISSIFVGVMQVKANIPSIQVSGRYQSGKMTLTVTINHLNPTQSHFVDWIEVDLDGTIKKYTQSPQNLVDFTVTIDVGNVNPKIVKVRANCNLHGDSGWIQMPTYTLTVQPPEGSGTTNPSPASYTYYQVIDVPITATPTSGEYFSQWILDGNNIGSTNPYTIKMNTNHQIKAVFTSNQPAPKNYTLTILSPEGSGSTDPITGVYTYNQVVTVTVKATPATGYVFDQWILDSSNIGNTNPLIINMNMNHQLKALFKASPSGGGIPGYPIEAIFIGTMLFLILILKRNSYNFIDDPKR